jgi:chromosome segregation ATPase
MIKLKLKLQGTEVEYEGHEKFLETRLLKLIEATRKSENEATVRKLVLASEDQDQHLADLDETSEGIARIHEELRSRTLAMNTQIQTFLANIATLVDSPPDLIASARALQEANMSYNMQYLNLQQEMQAENRAFTALSNVMKSKHETVKNAINNIR